MMKTKTTGRPIKSGVRRELKTFRLLPEAIAYLESKSEVSGGSVSDVLNDILLTQQEPIAPKTSGQIIPFQVLNGSKTSDNSPQDIVKYYRETLADLSDEIQSLYRETLASDNLITDEYSYRDGMLEALESISVLLSSVRHYKP
jgi:hypothetical protein